MTLNKEELSPLAEDLLEKAQQSPLMAELLNAAFISGARWQRRNPNSDPTDFVTQKVGEHNVRGPDPGSEES